MRSTTRRTSPQRGPKKAAAYVGATAVLLGVGTAGALAFSTSARGSAHPVRHVAAAHAPGRVDPATRTRS
jgi:hypothetical protein